MRSSLRLRSSYQSWTSGGAPTAQPLLDKVDGFLRHKGYLILDRDPVFTEKFEQLLDDSGVKLVRLPARSPNLNAYAERFVLSI